MIPNDPRPNNDPSIPTLKPHVDGMIGLVKTQSSTSSTGTKSSSTSTPISTLTVSNAKSTLAPVKTSEVNAVQFTSSQQSRGKKKNIPTKGKNRKASNQQETTQTQEPTAEPKQKRKAKFPCMICEDEHYTKDYPHKEKVMKFLKGNSQPTVLTDPFPPQQQQMVAQNHAPSQGGKPGHGDASTSAHVLMMSNETVVLTTRAKTYNTTPDKQVNESPPSQPSTTTPPLSNGSLQIEKPIFDNVLRPPKGLIRKSTFNPNVRAA